MGRRGDQELIDQFLHRIDVRGRGQRPGPAARGRVAEPVDVQSPPSRRRQKAVFPPHEQEMIRLGIDDRQLSMAAVGKILGGHRTGRVVVGHHGIAPGARRAAQEPERGQVAQETDQAAGRPGEQVALHGPGQDQAVELLEIQPGRDAVQVGDMGQLHVGAGPRQGGLGPVERRRHDRQGDQRPVHLQRHHGDVLLDQRLGRIRPAQRLPGLITQPGGRFPNLADRFRTDRRMPIQGAAGRADGRVGGGGDFAKGS